MNDREEKIAMAVWGDRLSPVFDSARSLLVVNIKNGRAVGERHELLGPEAPFLRAAKLSEWGIKVLICGAISMEYAHAIDAYGIQIIPFITGEPQQVIEAYVKGTLINEVFRMPGFRVGHRNRFRGGRG